MLPIGRALAQCQGLQQTKRSWSWFSQRGFTCTSCSSSWTSGQRKSWAVSTWGLTVPSLPSRRPPFGTRQHTPESFPEPSKARTSPSKAGSLSLLSTAVATALLSPLFSSPGWSRHSLFTKLLRRDRKMNMGGFQGGSPCPKRPLAPSQSATLAVTSAGACHRVTKFWQAVCPAAWCSPTVALCSCTLPGRTLSRPKPDPQPRISSLNFLKSTPA